MTLTFQRHPFKTKQATLMVPWNRLVVLDVVTMMLEGEQEQTVEMCPHVPHDHYVMRPVVLSTWQHTQLGSCPQQSTVIPESQVINL
jgi:teneurin